MKRDNKMELTQSEKEQYTLSVSNYNIESMNENEFCENVYNEKVFDGMKETLKTFAIAINSVAAYVGKKMCESLMVMNYMYEMALKSFKPIMDIMFQQMVEFIEQYGEHFETLMFIDISEEIGFPLYLEINSELKKRLIDSYRKHGECNKEEMKQILFEYYSNDYVDKISKSITNTMLFKTERLELIKQGFDVYSLGYYGCANATFVTQINGMIRDIYDEKKSVVQVTKNEKEEVIECFGLRKWKDDSEIVMLLDVLYNQMEEALIWQWIGNYFKQYVYSSGEKYIEEYPKRHMICHGIQTNFDSKEMSLKLILCMDILTELAWRVSKKYTNDIYVECSYE